MLMLSLANCGVIIRSTNTEHNVIYIYIIFAYKLYLRIRTTGLHSISQHANKFNKSLALIQLQISN